MNADNPETLDSPPRNGATDSANVLLYITDIFGAILGFIFALTIAPISLYLSDPQASSLVFNVFIVFSCIAGLIACHLLSDLVVAPTRRR